MYESDLIEVHAVPIHSTVLPPAFIGAEGCTCGQNHSVEDILEDYADSLTTQELIQQGVQEVLYLVSAYN
jgi:hypothetical protein